MPVQSRTSIVKLSQEAVTASAHHEQSFRAVGDHLPHHKPPICAVGDHALPEVKKEPVKETLNGRSKNLSREPLEKLDSENNRIGSILQSTTAMQ